MQLFYWVNGWAGRAAWADEAARLFYVGALPLLATALAWLLIAAPPDHAALSRRRILAAGVLALLGAAGLWAGLVWAAREVWGTPIFSPRPFVTHRVNLLVVEPNDNSYPCLEVLVAAVLATLAWAASVRAGALAWGWAVLFGVARVFCGSNYPIDILAAWVLGWALAAFSLAMWRAPLRIGARGGGRLKWKRRPQAALSGAAMAIVVGAAVIELLGSPQALRLRPEPEPSGSPEDASLVAGSGTSPKAAAGGLPLDGRYGRQPQVEAEVRRRLEGLKLAHSLVEVEVAQISVGTSAYRAAAVSFEVQPGRLKERAEVAKSAARIARAALAADAETQNVDVLGVIFPTEEVGRAGHEGEGGAGSGGGVRGEAKSDEPKPLPVFTASIRRSDLVLRDAPAWASARGVDDGLWLRARSRLFIDPEVLPRAPKPLPTPPLSPTPAPQPTATARPIATARPVTRPKRLAPGAVARPARPRRPAPKPKPKPPARARPVAPPRARPKYLSRPVKRRAGVRRPVRRPARRKYLRRPARRLGRARR